MTLSTREKLFVKDKLLHSKGKRGPAEQVPELSTVQEHWLTIPHLAQGLTDTAGLTEGKQGEG